MGKKGSTLVPESVIDSAKRTLANVEQFRTHCLRLLSHSDPDDLARIPPLQRAQVFFLLAKATTILFALRLKCSGIDPQDHPVKSELERLSLYEDKLEQFIQLSTVPLRRSTTLNSLAATRFIEHSLPDLTSEQRKNMRYISKGERARINHTGRNVQKKRKYQSSEQGVQAAANEFLEKAARELFSSGEGEMKGPLRMDNSAQDDVIVVSSPD